jgi:hypothetical protein
MTANYNARMKKVFDKVLQLGNYWLYLHYTNYSTYDEANIHLQKPAQGDHRR